MPIGSSLFTRRSALPRVTPQNFDYSPGVVALMKHCEALVREICSSNLMKSTRRVGATQDQPALSLSGQIRGGVRALEDADRSVFLTLDSVVPRRAHVLDLGCGYGMATHWLATFTDTRTFWGVDYDENKIRVAQRSAPNHPRIEFTHGDLLTCDYPPGDAVLLLDVCTIGRRRNNWRSSPKHGRRCAPADDWSYDGNARAESAEHRNIHRWEEFATRMGMNRTKEGLHFQTLVEMETMLKCAGFARWELQPGAGNDSNVMLVAMGITRYRRKHVQHFHHANYFARCGRTRSTSSL